MRNKTKIINITLSAFMLISIFFIVKFNVFEKIEDVIKKQLE